MKTLSAMGYLGMVGGLFGMLAIRNLFSSSPIVIGVRAAALSLFLWARITFGRRSFHAVADPTEGGLVTGGPYRYIRHPIYASMCVFAWAGVAGHWTRNAGLWAALILVSAVVRIHCEEALVVARYPEYARYEAATWRMIPYVY
jgi:protein-S-isoprenylcysteine O-methyltransferase Ste14